MIYAIKGEKTESYKIFKTTKDKVEDKKIEQRSKATNRKQIC